MAITTLDGYLGAAKQKIKYLKTGSGTSVASQWHTLLNLAGTESILGNPGSINLSSVPNGSTNGRVLFESSNGFPAISDFGSGNTGYITGFEFSNTVAGKFMIYDRIWEAGTFLTSPLRSISLTTNASLYESRIPFKSDGVTRAWDNLELWVDISTVFANAATTLNITYINENGSTGRLTGASAALNSFATGRTFQMPLQAGDRGIQRITDISIGGTVAATGSFNIYLGRTLYTSARISYAGQYLEYHSFEKLGMPKIDNSTALALNFAADSTSTGIPDCIIEISNG
jgi:hypothetical protein